MTVSTKSAGPMKAWAGSPDVAVVGLGALGAACLYQLAKAGVKAVGLDRHRPPHDLGSSHGETRITRCGIGEGAVYAPLAIRAQSIWRELEDATGERLMLSCGVLTLGPQDGRGTMHEKSDFVRRAAEVAGRFAIRHETLTSAEIAQRWPAFQLRGDEIGYWEPGAGALFPERCIAAQLSEARRLGARIELDSEVIEIAAEGGGEGVVVRTAAGVVRAGRAIVAAGAWTPRLMGGWAGRLAIQPQAQHWFEVGEPAAFTPERFPVFIWLHGETQEGGFYGFPIIPGTATQAVKVATEHQRIIASPDVRGGIDPASEAQGVWRAHVQGRLRGVGPRAVKSAGCLYTTSPDSDFVIGDLDGARQVIVASACSGHGFKHSAALGELLATRVRGDPVALPAAFDAARFRPSDGLKSKGG